MERGLNSSNRYSRTNPRNSCDVAAYNPYNVHAHCQCKLEWSVGAMFSITLAIVAFDCHMGEHGRTHW